jgi:hypothetical protein
LIFLVLLLGGWDFWRAFLEPGFWGTLVWGGVTGFFAFHSIPGVVTVTKSKIYDLTKPIDKTAQQIIEDKYYIKNKDTIEADIVVFGHTHFASSYELESNKRKKLFINSGCWTGKDIEINGKTRYANTFVYLDESGAYILKWVGPENIECIEALVG